MNDGPFSLEALLQEAEGLAAAGKMDEARQLVGEILRLDDKNISAWALLSRLANSGKEEIFCLKRIVHLDPQQTWASAPPPSSFSGPPSSSLASPAASLPGPLFSNPTAGRRRSRRQHRPHL